MQHCSAEGISDERGLVASAGVITCFTIKIFALKNYILHNNFLPLWDLNRHTINDGQFSRFRVYFTYSTNRHGKAVQVKQCENQ